MELYNLTRKERDALKETPAGRSALRLALESIIQLLSPFAPHLAEELWHEAGGDGLVCHSTWPRPDAAALALRTLTVAVQLNGKLRAQISVPADASEAQVIARAELDENVARHLAGRTVKRRVYVPGRLVNFVVVG